VSFPRYGTVVDCLDFCSRLLQCVAVDFDRNANLCWLHFDPDNLLPDNTYGLKDVVQFVLERNCPVTDPLPETTTTTTTASSTTTTSTSTSTTTTTTTTTGTTV